MNIIRNSKISDDEPISERLIENWIHQYRAKLIKQDLDKGKYPNPSYIQEFLNDDGTYVHLVKESRPTENVYVSSISIPKTIDLNYKSGITFIGDVEGNEIQLVPESRTKWQQFRMFARRSTMAYLRNSYLYILNPRGLYYVTIRGLFEIPTELPGNTLDTKYPIPINMLPTLKEMILKTELNIELNSLSDQTNDSQSLLESNIKQPTR